MQLSANLSRFLLIWLIFVAQYLSVLIFGWILKNTEIGKKTQRLFIKENGGGTGAAAIYVGITFVLTIALQYSIISLVVLNLIYGILIPLVIESYNIQKAKKVQRASA